MNDKTNWPQWLQEAETDNATVEIRADGLVVWLGGVWRGGVWRGGEWRGGEWCGGEWRGGVWCSGVWCRGVWCSGEWRGGVWCSGEWRGGVWRGGVWRGGEWRGGVWRGGVWCSGVWCGGEWCGGVWRGGEWCGGVWRGGEWCGGVWRGGVWCGGVWCGGVWRGGEWCGGEWCGGVWRGGVWRDLRYDRLLYHASMCGIVFDAEGWAVAYRTTNKDGSGRHISKFKQPEGKFYEDDLPPAGKGTCCKGIHVASAAVAWRYFGIDSTCQFWRVEFRREDLLDCDGEKARIRGGIFTKIANPLVAKP